VINKDGENDLGYDKIILNLIFIVYGLKLCVTVIQFGIDKLHCSTVRFNSLNLVHQLMHFYIQQNISLKCSY